MSEDAAPVAEARLRASLAATALRIADANGFDAAARELLLIAIGQDKDGNPTRIPARTRAQAAARLLRAGIDIGQMTKRVGDEKADLITLNITISDPAIRTKPAPPPLDASPGAPLAALAPPALPPDHGGNGKA